MKAARDGMPWRHRGPRLLRAVSDSLADQCPLPDTETGLIRLQVAARDRGLLGEGAALSGFTAASGGKQARSPHADPGMTVILADPSSSWLRRQRQRARPIVSLAAATAVAVIVVFAALLGSRGHHRTVTAVRPPVASPAPSPSRSLAPLRLRDIAGTWAGQVTQNSAAGREVFSVKLTVRTGSRRVRISYYGSFHYGSSFSCSGNLFPLSASSSHLLLRQIVTMGPCNTGTVTLTPGANGSLAFRFRGQGPPAATGTLTRRKG